MWQFSNPEDNEDAIRSCTGISGGPVLRTDTPYLSECGVSSSFSGIRSPQPSDGTAKEAPHFCIINYGRRSTPQLITLCLNPG